LCQKYIISREGIEDKLNIREYAIIQKTLKHADIVGSGGGFSFGVPEEVIR